VNDFITINDILTATEGNLISNTPTTDKSSFSAVGTDTRISLQGQLFVALQGESHDAHEYLDAAVKVGALGLLVHRLSPQQEHLKSKIIIILVKDTLKALQDLGLYRRHQWGKKVIALTGSNGKTTTKEFMAQILSTRFHVHYNQGSFNNHWGVPLTLLGLKSQHDIAICEMGMNHAGEINSLVKISEPNIVGVTTVGRAHLENLGSIQAIAEAKAEIYQFQSSVLQSHAPSIRSPIETRIFNLDNEWTRTFKDRLTLTDKSSFSSIGTDTRVSKEQNALLTFSSVRPECDVCFQVKQMTLSHLEITGSIQGFLGTAIIPVFGKQNIGNLMFAACAALAAGLTPEEIWAALPRCKTIWGRNQKLSHPSTGAEILFDAYNANPDSQKALIENLKLLTLHQPLIGVFGEMKELGVQSPQLHEELGALVATAPFHQVFYIGNFADSFKSGYVKNLKPSSFSQNILTYPDINEDLIQKIQSLLSSKPLISIKGSRGVGLERILKALKIL